MEEDFNYQDIDGTEIEILEAKTISTDRDVTGYVKIGDKVFNNRTHRWERILEVAGKPRLTEVRAYIKTKWSEGFHFFHIGHFRKRTIDVTDIENMRIDYVEDGWKRKSPGLPDLKHPIYRWHGGAFEVFGVKNNHDYPISVNVSWNEEQSHMITDVLVLPGKRIEVGPMKGVDHDRTRYRGFVETAISLR